MAKQTDFNKFLSNIEPSPTTVSYISSIQTNLREYLKNHEEYKKIHVDTFLSGSYAKHTSIRPVLGDKKRDVDIIVVTSYQSDKNSKEVLEELKDVLQENSNYDTAQVQQHSVGIEMRGISVDVVPVIADEEDDQLYYVGDTDSGEWSMTDPKGHKEWSTSVNKDNNNEYKPLVKIIKWWRRYNCPEDKKYPKGITLEKIVADNLGDSSLSTEDFLITTLQNIVLNYKESYVDENVNPIICDPSEKIDENDLLEGYSVEDFAAFVNRIEEHLNLLNTEGTTNATWRKVLGTEFPSSSTEANNLALSNLKKCIGASHRQRPKWPMQRGGAAFIAVSVTTATDEKIEYSNNSVPLDKDCSLHFRALTGVKQPFMVMWQITNTGDEAQEAECLRGNFEQSDYGLCEKHETTSYSGSHSVQCFIIKKGICVAKSEEFIVNVR